MHNQDHDATTNIADLDDSSGSSEKRPVHANATTHYKSELIAKFIDLKASIIYAPLDVALPRESLIGLLSAAVELVNLGEQDTEHAERSMRAKLTAAITPLGLYVGHRAYSATFS